ncbi:High-affinity branched-chain amino acid transport system permease protein LivH [Xylophilus ampelinus]|nr:branched-chain amino acid ABC transporter permease [Variovorax sp.]VTY31659.1 High-affinity branched-chain amino acid transport system permease protein LivH [Xylophilus ampelinus]
MSQLAQILLSGVAIGAVYSLAALGFTIVFNATRVTNFANGDFVMMGGLVAATLVAQAQLNQLLAVALAIVAVTALGVALDQFGLQQARRKTILGYAMITIGFSVLYRGLMQVTAGRDVLFMPAFGVIPDFRAWDVYLSSQSIWILLTLAVVSAALTYLYLRTRIGKAMRAASQNARAAALCGIEPRFMSALAFAMAAAVGAIAGALVAPVGAAFYEYGLTFGLKGFAAAVLGGFGSPVGAVVGGLLIGVLESLSAGYLSSGYKDAVALAILLALLLAWPSGLLGRVEAKRV